MKRYEKESFVKSFLLFFSLQLILLFFIALNDYQKSIHTLKDSIKNKMELCSYSLDCKDYKIDFIDQNEIKFTNKLLQNSTELYSIYKVPTVKRYYLKLSISKKDFDSYLKEIRKKIVKNYTIYLLLILLLSYLFSTYSLSPLKKALKLNDEFVKDILHDFNTPISSMVINLKILQKKLPHDKSLLHIKNSIDNILSLQENLKNFLSCSKLQKEKLNLSSIIKDRVDFYKGIYPNLEFSLSLNNLSIISNKDAVIRILDNLLSNACKYNKQNGIVKVTLQNKTLTIEDSGKGIKDTKRVFDRYYKESQRGLGLGLHIVKKLCDELDIEIFIKSSSSLGTIVKLDFKKVILE